MNGVVFFTPLAKKYQRNRNSRSKTKNLRCFPCCTVNDNHNTTGFCGRSVEVRVEASNDIQSLKIKEIFACATFSPADETPVVLANLPNNSERRSLTSPTAKWIGVDVARNEDLFIFVINPDLLGWHYGYKSNKSKSTKQHVLVLYVYKKLQQNRLHLMKLIRSSCFTICSRESIKDETINETQTASTFEKRKLELQPIYDECSFSNVLSRKKVEKKPSSTPLDSVPVWNILHHVIMKLREQIVATQELCETENQLDDNETLKFVESLLLEGEDLQGSLDLDQVNIEDEDDENVVDDAVTEQIIRTITSDVLTAEITKFLNECTSGTVGGALCESLKMLDDFENSNVFLMEFAKSLYRRFQFIISRRLEADLYKNGFISSTKLEKVAVRGSLYSTKKQFDISGNSDSFCEYKNSESLKQFLELLKYYQAFPKVKALIQMKEHKSKSNPYHLINKHWVHRKPMKEYFEEILHRELLVIDLVLAKILSKMLSSYTYCATNGKVLAYTTTRLGAPGYIEILTDNEPHEFIKLSPLFQFIVVPVEKYIARQSFDDNGNYRLELLLTIPPPYGTKYFYLYEVLAVDMANEYLAKLTRKVLKSENPLDLSTILDMCRQRYSSYIHGEPEYVYYLEGKVL